MGAFECVSANKISPTESTEVFRISMSSNTTLNEPRTDLESQAENPPVNHQGKTKLYWALGTDLPLLLFFIFLLGMFELGYIPGNKGGFHCKDPSLSYKYKGDTVSQAFLMTTVYLIPLVCILLTEYIFVNPDPLGRSKLQRTLISTFHVYRTFLYGFFLNLGLVEVMKGVMGKPRPTFFDLCEPDKAVTCIGSEYVTEYQCTSKQYGWWSQADSYRSFPSGHTSFSVYTAFFTAWYLQRRAFNWENRSTFLVPCLQLLLCFYAVFCSLTRITDHKHHWWDVLVGAFIGIFIVLYAVVLSKNFTYNFVRSTREKLTLR